MDRIIALNCIFYSYTISLDKIQSSLLLLPIT